MRSASPSASVASIGRTGRDEYGRREDEVSGREFDAHHRSVASYFCGPHGFEDSTP